MTQNLKNRAEKLDRFFYTYIRVFEPEDTEKAKKKNNRNKFIFSLAIGPAPLLFTLAFPYPLIFGNVQLVYMVPVYFATFVLSREFFGHLSYRSDLRFKEKMYTKYKETAVLTKDEVIEIEEAMKRELLKIEIQKVKEIPNNEKKDS